MELIPVEAAALVTRYQEQRQAKDVSFISAQDSPLALQYRSSFKGLAYYPVDLKYRFKGPIHRLPKPVRFQIMSNTGELREALHWGYFRFTLDGKRFHVLQVYRMLDLDSEHSKSLFLPFMDSQAGRETYGSGRYLDVEERDDGIYIIDFNAAYNPYCAYGKGFSCPMTPHENRLNIPIPAGEKSFHSRGEDG